jgi:hypothetical protein
MTNKLSARGIINGIKSMSARPEFYSGRGATISDLNGQHLQTIYDGIKANHGDDAAKNFVVMVADIPVLSATDFLLALYRLEALDWKWEAGKQPKTNGLAYNNEMEAMATVAEVLSGMFGGPRGDDTQAIRGSFLRQHSKELPKKEKLSDALLDDGPVYYDPWGDNRGRW